MLNETLVLKGYYGFQAIKGYTLSVNVMPNTSQISIYSPVASQLNLCRLLDLLPTL